MTRSRRLLGILAALGVLAGVASCNNPYDLLLHDRFEQAEFNSKVDIVWIIDSSNSMSEIQEEIRSNFGSFISSFANVDTGDGEDLKYGTVTEGAVAFAEFLQNQERFLNYNMAVTTTDVENPGNGNQGNLRSLGPIGGGGCESPEILTPQNADVADIFRQLADVGVTGSGTETGVLAAAYALCKGMPDSYWDGFVAPDPTDLNADPLDIICARVPAAERSCNQGFFREGAATVFIVVSDEGDATYIQEQLPPPDWTVQCENDHLDDSTFGNCACQLEYFLRAFDSVAQPVIFATASPSYQRSSEPVAWCDGSTLTIEGPCNPNGSPTCSLDFYQQVACQTAGVYTPIMRTTVPDDANSCQLSNFEQALDEIGKMISNLGAGWELSTTPDPDTISVYTDSYPDGVPASGVDSASGGWRYVPRDRAIAFDGEFVPSFNEEVNVYYYPLHDRSSLVGRALPF